MNDTFATEMAKIAEAYCVEQGIECRRKFTDFELEHARDEVRKAARQLAQMNGYADVMVKRDRAERHSGRPEHDLDIAGRPLRAGT